MEPRRAAKRTVDRIALAFTLHLALLLLGAPLSVPSYAPLGILFLLLRFLLPLALLFLPPQRACIPQMLPKHRGGWLDLLPAWALLLLFGMLLPGGSGMPAGTLPLLFLQLTVLTPVLEELLFRALPLTLCRFVDKRLVLLVLSLFFALLHSGVGKAYALFAGLLFGYGLLLGHGALWSILLHALNNLTALLLLLLAEHAPALFTPVRVGAVAFIVVLGAVIAFFRAKRGAYRLPAFHYETEDGAPVSPAVLAAPSVVLLLAVLALTTILLL